MSRDSNKVHIFLAIDCSLKIDQKARDIRLDTIYEIQPAIGSEITPLQLISESEYAKTYVNLAHTLGFNSNAFMKISLEPHFLFRKDSLRAFMKKHLPIYTPKFLHLEDASSTIPETQEKFQQALRDFYDDCVREKTTQVVIKEATGTKGKLNFFINLPKQPSYTDFFKKFITKLHELKNKIISIKSGFFSTIINIENENLILEQCRNGSYSPEKRAAYTYRLILAAELENQTITKIEYRVVSMQIHPDFNSHRSKKEICFFDRKVWVTDINKYISVSEFDERHELSEFEKRINGNIMLKADMRRISVSIIEECAKEGIVPERPSEITYTGLDIFQTPNDFENLIALSQHSFFTYKENDFDELICGISRILDTIKSAKPPKIVCKWPDKCKSIQFIKDANSCSFFLFDYGSRLAQWLPTQKETNSSILDTLISHFKNPEYREVLKFFLILLHGTENTEDLIKSKLILHNGFTREDLDAIVCFPWAEFEIPASATPRLK